jgi:HEAT repeat protein
VVNRSVPADESAGLVWLDAAVASGDVVVGGNEFRSRVFAAVNADRNGSVVRRLFQLAVDPRPSVRLTALTLLNDVFAPAGGGDPVADVAAAALADPDDAVRRAACWLFVASAGVDRAAAALSSVSDPVVRVALAEAVSSELWQRPDEDRWPRLVAWMRRDGLPAVRFLGSLAALITAGPEGWAGLDAAVREDLDTAAGALGGEGGRSTRGAGQRWAAVLRRRDREEGSYSWVERLLRRHEPDRARQAGLDIAAEAMRTWRAAPVRLTPALSTVLVEPPSPVRVAAVEVVCASLTATRLTADHLVPLLAEPALSTTVATALGSIGDPRAVPVLLRMLRTGGHRPRLAGALAAVAPALSDRTEVVITARKALAGHRDPCHEGRSWQSWAAVVAVHALAAVGPAAHAAVPELTARLRAAVDRGDPAAARLEVFALQQIGPPAKPAVALLRPLMSGSDRDADLAARAVLAITLDRSVADDYLDARPEQLRRCRIAPHLLTWLADQSSLTDRQVRQMNHLFTQPGAMQVGVAATLWRHSGPAAAPRLLAELPKYLDDDAFGPTAMTVLGTMGRFARPALPHLDRLIESPHRTAVYLGDPDAEMRADEQLFDLAITTRTLVRDTAV